MKIKGHILIPDIYKNVKFDMKNKGSELQIWDSFKCKLFRIASHKNKRSRTNFLQHIQQLSHIKVQINI